MLKDFSIKTDDEGIMRPFLTCGICGGIFPVDKSMHYVSRDKNITGLASITRKEESTLYDSFDCPICGCQNRLQERKYTYKDISMDEMLEDVSEDSESSDDTEEYDAKD